MAKGVKILVVGDLMLDHYIWGSCDRISPEAPVQVVKIMIDEEDTDSMYRTSEYRTIDMWSRLSKMINDFFDSISIADLIVEDPGNDFII